MWQIWDQRLRRYCKLMCYQKIVIKYSGDSRRTGVLNLTYLFDTIYNLNQTAKEFWIKSNDSMHTIRRKEIRIEYSNKSLRHHCSRIFLMASRVFVDKLVISYETTALIALLTYKIVVVPGIETKNLSYPLLNASVLLYCQKTGHIL